MSTTEASQNQPDDQASAKKKRSRKSTKKARTTADQSDDEDQTAAEEKPQDKQPVDEAEDDAESGDEGKGGKRRRKRSRSAKKAKAEQTTVPLGPDPELDLRLSEHGKKAIAYAQLFTSDKEAWKFNKAKQNWLLRNALSLPPADYDPTVSTRQPEAQEEPKEDEQEGDNFIPEVFVPVVAAYLLSVLGGAKVRLVESLNEALNAPAPTVEMPPQEDKPEPETQAEGKSVSFGDMAMEADKKEQEQQDGTAEARIVEQRRQRAKNVLAGMGEV